MEDEKDSIQARDFWRLKKRCTVSVTSSDNLDEFVDKSLPLLPHDNTHFARVRMCTPVFVPFRVCNHQFVCYYPQRV